MAQLAQAKIQEASTNALSNLLSSYKANMSGAGTSGLFASLLSEAGSSMPVVQPYEQDTATLAKSSSTQTRAALSSEPVTQGKTETKPVEKDDYRKDTISKDKQVSPDETKVEARSDTKKEDVRSDTQEDQDSQDLAAQEQTTVDEAPEEKASKDDKPVEDALDEEIATLLVAMGAPEVVKTEEKTSEVKGETKDEVKTDDVLMQPVGEALPLAGLTEKTQKTRGKKEDGDQAVQAKQAAQTSGTALPVIEQAKGVTKEEKTDDLVETTSETKDGETLSLHAKMVEEGATQTVGGRKDASQDNAQKYADLLKGETNTEPKATVATVAGVTNGASTSTTASESTGNGAVQSVGGTTSAQNVTGLAGGVRPAGSYDFASQLSAARVTKGGNAGLPQAVEQVSVQLHKAVKEGLDQITIQLKPAELGKIEIKLDITADKSVTGTVIADSQATLNMLQKDSSSLQRALQEAGLQADAGCMQFSLRDDNQARQFSQNANDNAGSKSSVNVVGIEDSAEETISSTATETYYLTPGRVNLRV